MFYVPQNNSKKLQWLTNFKAKFPDAGASNNFSDDEINRVIAACDSLIFSIMLAQRARSFSKACTSFRNEMFKSDDSGVMTIPFFIVPEAPETLAPRNALVYLQKVVRRLKTQANYSEALGVNLRIIATKPGAPQTQGARPKGKLRSLSNSVVRIDWTKGKFHGVLVYSKRNDETEWTLLDRDNYSPYIDTRQPLEAGKPEIRYYRLIYLLDDKAVGEYSDIFTQVTIP